MAGSGDNDMRMLAEQPHFDFDVGWWLSHDGDVQVIAAQGITDILAVADLQHHVDLWKSPRERRNGERYEIFRRADGADGHASTPPGCNHIQRLLAIEKSGFDPIRQ